MIIGVTNEGTRDLEILVEIGVFEKIGEKKGTKHKLIEPDNSGYLADKTCVWR